MSYRPPQGAPRKQSIPGEPDVTVCAAMALLSFRRTRQGKRLIRFDIAHPGTGEAGRRAPDGSILEGTRGYAVRPHLIDGEVTLRWHDKPSALPAGRCSRAHPEAIAGTVDNQRAVPFGWGEALVSPVIARGHHSPVRRPGPTAKRDAGKGEPIPNGFVPDGP